MEEDMLPAEADQCLVLGAMLWDAILEANGGRVPETIWHYRCIGRRFGVRFRVMPRWALPEPLLRFGGRDPDAGVIYLPRTYSRAQLRLWALHELGEAGCFWEGRPPVRCSVSGHRIAAGMGYKAAYEPGRFIEVE